MTNIYNNILKSKAKNENLLSVLLDPGKIDLSTIEILIESGTKNAVERVSKTKPLDRNNYDLILATAQAGEMLVHKFIYLEAGNGANQAITLQMTRFVSQNIKIPLIVGGGIIDLKGIQKAYDSGADLVVIGTAFEKDVDFFNK